MAKQPKQQPLSDSQRVSALMKELGSPSGFDPIPPDQHKWMLDPTQPPLQRMWAWMLGHTIHWGHRTAYATDKGSKRPLHIEDIAEALKNEAGEAMDLANCYRVWRRGVARGLWRNGTEQEGLHRLYLTGKVPKWSEDQANAIVCTDNFPVSILKQIQEKGWSAEQRFEFLRKWDKEQELQGHVQAALIAANRAVFTQRQDSILSEAGLEPIHQEHQKKHETKEDAEARRSRLKPILAPIQEYVQTIAEFVQTAPSPPRETPVSLLPADSKNHRESPPVGRTIPRQRRREDRHNDGEKPINQLPALPNLAKTPALSDGEKQAAETVYQQIERMQGFEGFKHMEFTHERISRARKSDQLFVYRVLMAVGPDNVEAFLASVWNQLRRLDKNALGKLPGRAPAPRSLGLILQWAIDYGQNLAEAARVQEIERRQWIERNLKACYEILNDSTETGEAKFWASKYLEENALKDAQSA